jgi:hypothetical protein
MCVSACGESASPRRGVWVGLAAKYVLPSCQPSRPPPPFPPPALTAPPSPHPGLDILLLDIDATNNVRSRGRTSWWACVLLLWLSLVCLAPSLPSLSTSQTVVISGVLGELYSEDGGQTFSPSVGGGTSQSVRYLGLNGDGADACACARVAGPTTALGVPRIATCLPSRLRRPTGGLLPPGSPRTRVRRSLYPLPTHKLVACGDGLV